MTKNSFLIAAIIGLLLVGGGGFAFYTMKMNSSNFRGIAFPVKPVKDDVRKEWAKGFKEVLSQEDVLQAIVDETDYASKVEVSPDEAVSHLKKAIKVRIKSSNDTIEIGLMGKRKYDKAIQEVAPVVYEKGVAAMVSSVANFRDYEENLRKVRAEAEAEKQGSE